MSERTQKLLTLRARTDHDLLVIVEKELDRGFGLVDSTTARLSPNLTRAEKAHETTTALLPRISSLSADERLRIEARASDLRRRLDQVASVPSFPASLAS